MANKAHIWSKNDKITAERLNSMARPLNKILQGGGKDESTDKPHGDSDTANWANAIDDA